MKKPIEWKPIGDFVLDTPKAILIGSVLIAGVLLFNGSTNSTIADYSEKSYDQLKYIVNDTKKTKQQLVTIRKHLSNQNKLLRNIISVLANIDYKTG